MQDSDLYQYDSFSKFLGDLAKSRGKKSGIKAEMALAMGSHPAYLSRVLSGSAQLSLEQVERLAAHFGFERDHKKFLLLLLQEERAGTPHLREFFKEERTLIRNRRLNIKERIPESKEITSQDQSVYYSSWHYSAVHALASIPNFNDLESMGRYLNLPISKIREAVMFLEKIHVIAKAQSGWVAGAHHLHLDKSSPFIRQHHANWRMKTVQALDNPRESDIHYSSAVSLSQADAGKIKEKMLRQLKENLEIVSTSKEEKAYVYCLDFFEL